MGPNIPPHPSQSSGMGNFVAKNLTDMSLETTTTEIANPAYWCIERLELQVAEGKSRIAAQEQELASNRNELDQLTTELRQVKDDCGAVCDRIDESDKMLIIERLVKEAMAAEITQLEEEIKKKIDLEEKVKGLQRCKNEVTRLKTKAKEARARVEKKDEELKQKCAALEELQQKYAALAISQLPHTKNASSVPEKLQNKQRKSRKNQWGEVQAKFADEIAAEVKKHVTPLQIQIDTANAALGVSRRNAANGSKILMATKAIAASKESEIEVISKAHVLQMKAKEDELHLYKHVVDALWPIRSRQNFKYLIERTPRMLSLKLQGSKIAHEGNLTVDVALCVLGYFDVSELLVLEKKVYKMGLAPFTGSFENWRKLLRPSMQITRELACIGATLFGCGESIDGDGGFEGRRERLVNELHSRLKGIKDIAKADEIRIAYYEMPEVQTELRDLWNMADQARCREWMRKVRTKGPEEDRQGVGGRTFDVNDRI